MEARLKLLVWMNYPSHHQSAFLEALREAGVDLVVHYFGELSEERKEQGWKQRNSLPSGERYVTSTLEALETCPDWRERVHIVGGFSHPFLARLTVKLSQESVRWVPWLEHVWDLHPSERRSSRLVWMSKFMAYRLYGWCIERWAIGALGISRLAQQALRSWGIDRENIRIVPYAVPALEAGESTDPEVRDFGRDASPLYLHLGTLCYRKAIDVLLEAFAEVLESAPEARLALVGKTHENNTYQRLARRLGIDDRVLFRGPVPSDKVAGVIEYSDVCVLPSRHDGWGMFPSEAASLGKPVIATRLCGSGQHLVQEGENGYLVEPESPEQLTDVMLEYVRHPEWIERHGERSRERFQLVTPEANAERMIQAVRELT